MTNFQETLKLEQLKLEFTSGLGKAVIEELESYGSDWESHLSDIINHGCVSGTVSSLVYYNQTNSFHDENEDEINDLIFNLLDSSGITFEELVNGRFEIYEIDQLKNFKTWLAFEETAHEINNYLEQL